MNVYKDYNIKNGYVDSPVDKSLNLKEEIIRLKKEKDAVLLAHFYQNEEIKEIADFIGDSLALAREAVNTNSKIILFAGVNFMAETAKILNYDKKVILPDLNAGCSLADSCNVKDLQKLKEQYPDYLVISYINTTTEVKALSDIICTSTNAVAIVNSLPKEQKIIFCPDKNLGNYVKSITGREMIVWEGACHVHQRFSVEKIVELKKQYPEAKLIAHPECNKAVLIMADFIASTNGMLKYTKTDSSSVYIVATESGILPDMKKLSPEKSFIPAPPDDSECACNDCQFMKLITLEKVYNSLKFEAPVICIEKSLRDAALKPITEMLRISDNLKI